MQKPKYITNKDLLREIHKSKATYCYFEKPEYANFDAIVLSLEAIDDELIDRILLKKNTPKGKVIPTFISERKDLIFRVMTHDHIPLDPDRKRKARNTDKSYARTNFPPFKHYVYKDDELVEVGRSHWKGDIETGAFCLDKGAMSNQLAMMFMLLVERYSRRGNWRGYCVDTETEALTKRGWLRHDQITEDDTILSCDVDGQLRWSKITSIYRNNYQGDMFKLEIGGLDALVTPGHKFLTTSGLKKAEHLLETDRIVLMGKDLEDATPAIYDDAFVELVGWTVTEGNMHRRDQSTYDRVTIYQNEGNYAQRIRNCLNTLGFTFSELLRPDGKQVRFLLNKEGSVRVAEAFHKEGKTLSMEFMTALTSKQRHLLIETMINGEGHRRHGIFPTYSQKDKAHSDAFRVLCTLSGIRTSMTLRDSRTPTGDPTEIYVMNLCSTKRNLCRFENVDMHGGKRSGTIKGRGKVEHPNEPSVPYNGKVWCPTTEYGTFVCRRNEHIYVTGNSYNDEMRSHALLQLSQIGLQFDESKSDNPFAFYTTAIRNCFTRILNLERRHQNIRDDMLIVAGASPSYTRQIESELESKFPEAIKKGTPGRKPGVKKPAES